MDEVGFMRMAVDEARKSRAEDARPHPLVGAVVVRDGQVLAAGHRGEFTLGEHAEFTVLERKLAKETIAGATVYTTLEPCTSRNHPKIACVHRLIERKVARVVIGMLDPNPDITGKGQRALRDANVTTDLFPTALMSEIEDLNREFTRFQQRHDAVIAVSDPKLIALACERSLDDWYRSLNRIYWHRNYLRDPNSIFAHLVEVVGGLSSLASSKSKKGVDAQAYIVKALAWWLSLCGKLGVRSIEEMLWDKFPSVCTYCQKKPHDSDICLERKAASGGPPWEVLAVMGEKAERPKRLRDWQSMFAQIYPVQQTEDYGPSFARLAEELGELAEAVRIFSSEPGYLLSEAADVFAWIMHIQNILHSKSGINASRRGEALEQTFARSYPNGCLACSKKLCACPPILASTIGRIAHEVPRGRGSYGDAGRFMTPDIVSRFFQD
jgi:pyrimidine deaminase RibD-like protein/NTP pyrophosphatase (non-canonical NTP hydrolase)